MYTAVLSINTDSNVDRPILLSLPRATDMCRLGIHPELSVRRYSWWRDSPKGWLVTRWEDMHIPCICTLLFTGLHFHNFYEHYSICKLKMQRKFFEKYSTIY